MRETRARSPQSTRDLAPADAGQPSYGKDRAGIRIERLYEDYSGRVYRYCLRRLDSPEEAEDALQATYLNAWRSLSRGVEPISARPWLFQIAANVCSSTLRTRLTGAVVELRSPEAFDRMPTNPEPHDDLLGLSAALEGLPERQRRALLLRDWRGLSYDEIAVELGASYEAVETLLFRARKSVAAGLRAPEPSGIPVKARALAPLPFLLPFKHATSSAKAYLASTVGPLKVSLGIALGAAAPLVAYGLVQQGGIVQSPAAETASPPVVQMEAAQTPANSMPAVEKAAPAPTPKKQETASPSRDHASAAGPSGTASGASPEHVVPGGSDAGFLPPPHPAPPPQTDPPPQPDDDDAAPSQVTICHHTGSKKNPTVTITVGADSVAAHLAHGDELGACAG